MTQLILFVLTAVSIVWWFGTSDGYWYAGGVLSILLAHEFGHYFAARHYGVPVTLPYFLPGIPPLYTFGAFIKMEARPMSSQALLVIGAAGPIAGMIVALPLYVVGILMSTVEPLPAMETPGMMQLGESVLSLGLVELLLAPPTGHEVYIHPLGYAAWVGFFVTALNLLPVGQLDGGHIAWAMFGKRWKKVARWMFRGMVVVGALLHPVWLVMSIFLVVTGVEHPPITEDTQLPKWCRVVGWTCLVIFVLTLMPVPTATKPLPMLLFELF